MGRYKAIVRAHSPKHHPAYQPDPKDVVLVEAIESRDRIMRVRPVINRTHGREFMDGVPIQPHEEEYPWELIEFGGKPKVGFIL